MGSNGKHYSAGGRGRLTTRKKKESTYPGNGGRSIKVVSVEMRNLIDRKELSRGRSGEFRVEQTRNDLQVQVYIRQGMWAGKVGCLNPEGGDAR